MSRIQAGAGPAPWARARSMCWPRFPAPALPRPGTGTRWRACSPRPARPGRWVGRGLGWRTDEGKLKSLVVAPSARRRGTGTLLLLASLAQAAALGTRRLLLKVARRPSTCRAPAEAAATALTLRLNRAGAVPDPNLSPCET